MFEFKKFLKSFFYKTSPYSQAGQDVFAYELFGFNGTYIDIGAGEPKRGNNCYMLEVQKKWKGFSVEYGDPRYKLKNVKWIIKIFIRRYSSWCINLFSIKK